MSVAGAREAALWAMRLAVVTMTVPSPLRSQEQPHLLPRLLPMAGLNMSSAVVLCLIDALHSSTSQRVHSECCPFSQRTALASFLWLRFQCDEGHRPIVAGRADRLDECGDRHLARAGSPSTCY
jgi:hypothetical protein